MKTLPQDTPDYKEWAATQVSHHGEAVIRSVVTHLMRELVEHLEAMAQGHGMEMAQVRHLAANLHAADRECRMILESTTDKPF